MPLFTDASVAARASGLWPTDGAYLPFRELDTVSTAPLHRIARWLFDTTSAVADPDPELDRILRQVGTGGWRIRRATAHALALLAREAQPRVIVEFGSGLSTLVFALATAAGGEAGRIVSIEEQPAHAQQTRALLARFGCADAATILTVPVVRRAFDGWEGYAHAVHAGDLGAALAGRRADLVFIDGPASWLRGRRDCRYGTLPSVRPWAAERALFLADDALRPGDLAILRRWRRSSYVDVFGVIAVGRGLGIGCLHGPAA